MSIRGECRGQLSRSREKGKLAYYESFGFVDKVTGTPMPKDAIFALASMTKPMVAVATLMLTEQGDLLLNDPIGNYLAELKDMKVATPRGIEPAHRQPTLQDMLRHTEGVSYGNRRDCFGFPISARLCWRSTPILRPNSRCGRSVPLFHGAHHVMFEVFRG